MGRDGKCELAVESVQLDWPALRLRPIIATGRGEAVQEQSECSVKPAKFDIFSFPPLN